MGAASEGTDPKFDQALVSKAKHLTKQVPVSQSELCLSGVRRCVMWLVNAVFLRALTE